MSEDRASHARLLIGQRVTVVRRDDPAAEPSGIRGVLLPPAGDGPVRVHPDGSEVPFGVDPDGWIIAHERTAAERAADRGRQACPAGRPLYRRGHVPGDQLATDTMLRRMRRRRRPGQEPIASYKLQRGFAAMYAVADAETLRPLTPLQEAAWDQARTCARCGTASAGGPLQRGRDGDRYCEPCQEPAARLWWDEQRVLGRQMAAAWARAVLADASVLLVMSAYDRPISAATALHVETLAGEVLLDRGLLPGANRHRASLRESTFWTAEQLARIVDPADVAEQLLTMLSDKRLITWHDLYNLRRVMTIASENPDVQAAYSRLRVTSGDRFGDHWTAWVGEHDSRGHSSYRHNGDVRRQDPPREPADAIAAMREGLHQMAGTSPTPTHPIKEEL